MSELARLLTATAGREPPFALVDLDAMWSNARSMTERALGKPIRLASKSVRCRSLQERVLTSEGFRGTLAFTLPEALWLAEQGFDDIVVAYPTVDRSALTDLGRLMQQRPETRLTVMVDCTGHLDAIEAAAGSVPIRVAIDVDAGLWLAGGRIRIGAKRSPVHAPDQAEALARDIDKRPGCSLVGLMLYEAQIAGVGDAPKGKPARGLALRAMQARSRAELVERRAEVVRRVARVTPLEFVNGGGTGSISSTAREPEVSEIGAGSGLYAPVLFDYYSTFALKPAAMFCLPVVRKPGPDSATVLGGGYLASGPGESSRLPSVYLPQDLRLDRQEGAGEVQTPLLGPGAAALDVGDRVFFRHAKAGELCERFASLLLVEGNEVVDEVPTYRGEGKTFL
ncbi:MAG: amino acid deaminase/aldolase [Actinomycetota bacterium]